MKVGDVANVPVHPEAESVIVGGTEVKVPERVKRERGFPNGEVNFPMRGRKFKTPMPEKLEGSTIKEHNEIAEDRKNRIWRDPAAKGRPCGECSAVEGKKHQSSCGVGDRMAK